MKRRRPKALLPTTSQMALVSRNALNLFLVGALSLNIFSAGLPALIASYNDAQARIPHALASDQKLDNPPAADAGPTGHKAVNIPDSLKDQLADQYKKEHDGKARDPRHVQALDEGRNATDRIYLNADGTKSLVHSLQATSFKDADGKWQDVDTSLVQDDDRGKWHTKANSWQASFGDISSDGVLVTQDNQTFSFTPVGGKSVMPTVTGNAPDQVVTYRNVWQGIDLQYEVTGSELKE